MERKHSEGSKGGLSKFARPDKQNPTKPRQRNTDVESRAGNRSPDRARGRDKGG